MTEDRRRALPKVDVLVNHPRLAGSLAEWGRATVARASRRVLEASRQAALDGREVPPAEGLVALVQNELKALGARRIRAVINATGVVLHTNLGRAPLSQTARDAVLAAAAYSTVEYTLSTGARGRRGAAAHALLRELTGAREALAVNNAAAALMLSLAALARGREVVVSRGELIEIGGEFRLPALMEAAGVTLVEVGTTNRTHLHDYADAIGPDTAMLLAVHTSNYRVQGFTTSPALASLVQLAHDHSLPLLHDVGSGLVDGTFGDEPSVASSLAAGADLVIFSGDKLLGGPQAGMVVGRDDLVSRLARHPIARAVRIDKLTMAALEATLVAHVAGRRDELPVWQALLCSPAELRRRAEAMVARLAPAARLREGVSVAGGGSLPGEGLPGFLVDVDPRPGTDAAVLALLRGADPPVIARAERGRVVIDLRTVSVEQEEQLFTAVVSALRQAAVEPRSSSTEAMGPGGSAPGPSGPGMGVS
jgi:L-seryl-tRNA(Ser) seleniumtransferase